jgi:hypothetical protein
LNAAAEATAKSQVKMAQAVTAEIGPQLKCAFTKQLASVGTNHAGERINNVLLQHNLTASIKLSTIEDGICEGHTVIKLTDLVEYMLDQKQFSRFYGGLDTKQANASLAEFWDKFLQVHPSHHAKFKFEKGQWDPARTVPVEVYGDEGRGNSQRLE